MDLTKNLPYDIKELLLSFLSFNDIKIFCSVSRYWKDIIQNHMINIAKHGKKRKRLLYSRYTVTRIIPPLRKLIFYKPHKTVLIFFTGIRYKTLPLLTIYFGNKAYKANQPYSYSGYGGSDFANSCTIDIIPPVSEDVTFWVGIHQLIMYFDKNVF